MPRPRSRDKAASPPSPAGARQRTPAPSPSTSLHLGIGPASPDNDLGVGSLDLKQPAAAPPRHSLLLAGAALRLGLGPASPDDDRGARSPNLSPPAAAPPRRSLRLAGSRNTLSVSGRGEKGARRAHARVSASSLATTVSPRAGNSSSDDSGSGADTALASGERYGSAVPFTTRSRIVKRRAEASPQAGGEVGIGSAGRGQVPDEMLHRDVGTPSKRCRTVLVGGVETVYMSDTESDSDEDCMMLGPSGTELNPIAVDMTENGSLDDPANASDVESLQTHNLLGTTNVGVVEQSVYPSGSASSFEARISADMYVSSHYSSRKGSKVNGKLVLENNSSRADANVGSAVGTSPRKFNPYSKGKGKMVAEDTLSSLVSSEDEPDLDPVHSKETQVNPGSVSASMVSYRRQKAKERAIRLAPEFAFFKADKDEHSEDDDEELEPGPDSQDWPGSFVTAARMYEEREAKLRARELNSSKLNKSANRVIVWSPSKDEKNPARAQAAPSLTSLCLNTLAKHSECIGTLEGIPEELKNRLFKILCHSRKMNTYLLNELLCDSPTELHLSECSWLSEDDFEKTFGKCSIESLQDLQLDISGRCMPDYILPTTLAKVPNCMPLLRKISLKGNYRLSDNGLVTIISAAPSLCSINLCECSLLTSSGINILANKLHSVLRELYIDDCTNVDAMAILPALQKINHLEVLSMSGIQSVCDKFVKGLIPVHGSNLKELAFAGCLELTSASIKTVGEYCQELTSLDLRNLNRLRDSALWHLRGCRLLRKLRLQRNAFSDEAVSQYLEESGGGLTELMLNNVKKVGDLTVIYSFACFFSI
ncbi:uncharacterized protein [Zea mays]|uniref:uncharacterized protein isoform X3 n=1 Tax=Zea mays TaxID=4577 RepID=UPI0009AA73EC|nr:uncharacterized protein LOC103643234 isoform X3 [Zea mays]|eukprot:XP_020402260.1 uncharacterized protein LOC103643234 isoform X3 [Zea mays]